MNSCPVKYKVAQKSEDVLKLFFKTSNILRKNNHKNNKLYNEQGKMKQ